MKSHAQSRLESFIEINLNIASGFVISLLVWEYIAGPLYGIETNMVQNLGIVGIFTVTAIIRSYVWRRYFNARLHRRLEEWLS